MSQDMLKTNTYRASVYKILSEFYYPPQDNISEQCSVLKEKMGFLYPQLAKHLDHSNHELRSLQIDFSKLFVGPFMLLSPPYGSIYIDNKSQVMGESTMGVLDMYQKHGLHIEGSRIPDHIGVELEFIYFLIMKEIASDNGNINHYRNEQKIFLEKYLAPWVYSFTTLLEKNAKTEFYKNLAALTSDFIKAEMVWMNN